MKISDDQDINHPKYSLKQDGHQIEYTVVYSSRRKRSIALAVKHTGIIVRAPMRTPQAVITKLLTKKFQWILTHQENIAQQQSLADAQQSDGTYNGYTKQTGTDYLTERTFEIAHRHGLSVSHVIVKQYRRKYGQCKGSTIYYDWRIMQFPPEIVDHIIIHELAHLIHKHHQKSFWAFVQAMDPDTKKHKKRLKLHGGSIYFNAGCHSS